MPSAKQGELNVGDVVEFIIYTFLSFLLFSAIIGFMWKPSDIIVFSIEMILAMSAAVGSAAFCFYETAGIED